MYCRKDDVRTVQKLRLRFRSLLQRPTADRELNLEVQFHLDQLTDENVAAGMSREDARRAARRTFGPVTALEEACRDMRRVHHIEGILRDIRYALRSLKRSPSFTFVVAATLALGIGGATAVFSVIQAVFLAPLPYEQPGQLVRFYQQAGEDPSTRTFLTGPHFRRLRDSLSQLQDAAAIDNYGESGLDLVHEGAAQRLRTLEVTSAYFRTLQSGPVRGREFERADEVDDNRLVILSDALWRARFHSDPAILGKSIRLSAEPYTVVGIAPAGFEDPIEGAIDAWLPQVLQEGEQWSDNHSISAVGRLRPGVSIEQARAELSSINPTFDQLWPTVESNALALEPLHEDLVAGSRDPLHLVALAVGMVLLLACVNVANLFLVRATGRARELAIRSSLGSGRLRIARQLLVESVLLAVVGGLGGLGLAWLAQRALLALGRGTIPRIGEVDLDPTVLAIAALLTLGTGLAFGLLPAVRFARMHPSQGLLTDTRSSTGSLSQQRLRNGLAAAQLALALTLAAGAGVLITSFHRIHQVDLGFETERVLAFELSLPSARYDAARRASFQEELAARIEAVPAVSYAGAISRTPATGSYHTWGMSIRSGPRAGDSLSGDTQNRTISGNFFAAVGIPVLAGRSFDDRDDMDAPPRVVVSAQFATDCFPGMPLDNVVGQRIATAPARLERQIIGVVGDVSLNAYGVPAPTVYHTHRQFAVNRNWALTHLVATDVGPESVLPDVEAVVAEMDPELIVYQAARLDELIGRGVGRERFALVLTGAFAFVALSIAAVGLYGVLAYSVRRRTREIGVRVALGATAAHVRGLVLRHAGGVLAIGLLAGVAGALAIGRLLTALAFETSPSDPRILLAAATLLTLVACLAAWLPARHASLIQPTIAIREE